MNLADWRKQLQDHNSIPIVDWSGKCSETSRSDSRCATNGSCDVVDLRPLTRQQFALSWHHDLRTLHRIMCFDVSQSLDRTPVILYNCHHMKGNQRWKYNVVRARSRRPDALLSERRRHLLYILWDKTTSQGC